MHKEKLCEAGLLMKRSGVFSKPNYLYVKYALEGQFFERVRKIPAVGSENRTYDSRDSAPGTVGYPAPNKVMNHSDPSNNHGVMERKPRGRYGNIFLSDKEFADCPFVLFVGTKKLVKRKEFEEFVRGKLVI